MPDYFEFPAWLKQAAAHGESVAQRLALPFRENTWKGQIGNWQGSSIGSSIDFQDHRQYQPGDDPRYINWQAYARTGNYSMKLYREEVSPQLDLVLDCSHSMFSDSEKALRSLELFYFAYYGGLQASASTRCYLLQGSKAKAITPESIRACDWAPPTHSDTDRPIPDLVQIPWRGNSMRVFISDLLYPGSPEGQLAPMAAERSRLICLAPSTQAEAQPDWLGGIEFKDSETELGLECHFSSEDLKHYLQNYKKHFSLWRESAHKLGMALAQVPASADLENALLHEAFNVGAVILWT